MRISLPDAPHRAQRPTVAAPPHTAGTELPTPEAIEDRHGDVGVDRNRDRTFRRMLLYADIVSACAALAVAVVLTGGDGLRDTTLLALPLIITVAKLKGLYDRDELLVRKTTVDEAPQLFQLATLSSLLIWLLDDVFVSGALDGGQVVVLWATLFAGALAARHLARAFAHRVTPPERCVFVGDVDGFTRLQGKLADGQSTAQLVCRMSLQRVGRHGAVRADAAELRELLAWTRADRLIIDSQALPPHDMLDFVRAAKSVGVHVSLLPRILDVVGSSVVFDQIGGVTLLGVRRFGLSRSSWLIKRAFDLTGASIGLLMTAPFLALIAAAIRFESRGPIFFRQVRVGRDGRHFRIWKFRTMLPDAEHRKHELLPHNEAAGGLFKIEDDPRITRVGRFLRRTSLDELPQLFNVLTGDMSLVGPRPLVCDEDERITGLDRRRLHLTPGMTGPWQILGSSRIPLQEMVKLDYLYVAGWSLWEDVKILLRTLPYVLARRGM
jgi:exopolysaccharide biosynthesis polyprenyl glycosylphosphotransferase